MNDDRVECPLVPGWWAERSWTEPGQTPSDFIVWTTDDDVEPYRMAHNRDLMMDGGELVQDYDFIDYWFGDPVAPITARHYLGSHEVSVVLPDRRSAQATVPPPVLRYLQRRFAEVKLLTTAGYVTVWAAPGS